MPAFTNPSFTDRIKHAASAKADMVERFKARPDLSDPRLIAKIEERRRIHEERLARRADRKRAQDEELARALENERLVKLQEEEAELARLMQAEASAEEARQARRDRLAQTAVTMADQKASRDARYAARKLRQKR